MIALQRLPLFAYIRVGLSLLMLATLPTALGQFPAMQPVRNLEQLLDQPIAKRLDISQRPVREAFAELSRALGIEIKLSEEAVSYLPYGERTQISIVLDKVKLRDGLRRVFSGLGFDMQTHQRTITTEPLPVLRRMLGPLTLSQIKILHKLASNQWRELEGDVPISIQIEPNDGARAKLEAAIRQAGSEPSAVFELEAATRTLGWHWLPTDQGIVVCRPALRFEQQLDSRISVDYEHKSLEEILTDIGGRTGIPLLYAPGVREQTGRTAGPARFQQSAAPVRQVLAELSRKAGFKWHATRDGVLIDMASGPQPVAVPPGANTPRIVAILRLPLGPDGTTIDFLIREDELPEEFDQLRERMMPVVIDRVREILRDQPTRGPTP